MGLKGTAFKKKKEKKVTLTFPENVYSIKVCHTPSLRKTGTYP